MRIALNVVGSQTKWAVYGFVTLLAGIALLVNANRRRVA